MMSKQKSYPKNKFLLTGTLKTKHASIPRKQRKTMNAASKGNNTT